MDLPVALFEVYLAKSGNNELQISENLGCWIETKSVKGL
jgi:hypothetical protein